MKPEGRWIEEAKKAVALKASKQVKDRSVIGLGSGSTAAYAIQEIGDRINQEEINVSAVPTSYQSLILAVEYGIPLTSLEEHPVLDLTIDGADQIDDQINLLKGMGGALAREKIVASASKKLIIIADERKEVKSLGENNHPVPLEVLPFALPVVIQKIRETGGKPVVREAEGKVGPVITDNGNVIVDVYLGIIPKLEEINYQLKRIPGVVETGIFVDMADLAYIGNGSEIKELRKTG